MVALIAELAAKHEGEVLCGELLRRDLNPTAMEVQQGGGDVLIALTILGDWVKGFVIPRDRLQPEYVELELERWKAKVRDDLASGSPTRPVQQAIQRYGMGAVQEALAPQFGALQL